MVFPMLVVINLPEAQHRFISSVETLLEPQRWHSTVHNIIDEIRSRASVDLSLFHDGLCAFSSIASSFTFLHNHEGWFRILMWIPVSANHSNYNDLEDYQDVLNMELLRSFYESLSRVWGPNDTNDDALGDNQDVLDMALQRSFEESLSRVRGGFGAVPATTEVINNLKTFILGQGEDEDRTVADISCAVCLEDIVLGEEACRMPCSHVYHSGCIRRWLEASRLCPLCRFALE